MQLIEQLNLISVMWKKQFEYPEKELWKDTRLESIPNIPLRWTISESGMLLLDGIWICPTQTVRKMIGEDLPGRAWTTTIEIDLTDGLIQIDIDEDGGEYYIASVERWLFYTKQNLHNQ